MEIIFRVGVWLRHLCIVARTFATKVMEYSSMAIPIYASWGIDTDIYYEQKYSVTMTQSNTLVHRT
jgi:hypothetical protein